MEQVARGAGFSKRTVYLYFKNKDDLFITVAEEGLLILREKLEAIPTEEISIEEGIQAVLDAYLWFAREHADNFRMIFQEPTPEMIRNAPTALRKRVEKHERACLGIVMRIVEKAIEQGFVSPVDPWEVAVIFWGSVTGVLLLTMGGSQTVLARMDREEIVRRTARILYDGLRNQGGARRGRRTTKGQGSPRRDP